MKNPTFMTAKELYASKGVEKGDNLDRVIAELKHRHLPLEEVETNDLYESWQRFNQELIKQGNKPMGCD